MIPISNGWMGNTISYSRVIYVMKGAEASARNRGIDQSRDMAIGEKLYDYIFCGSVKKQFMDQLHRIALRRLNLERRSAKLLARGGTEALRNGLKKEELRNDRNPSKRLSRLMSGNTLEFGNRPYEHSNTLETFLIYRDRRRFVTAGLPLKLREPAPAAEQSVAPLTSIPTFDSPDDIQISDLNDILRSRKLKCGELTCSVRFTAEQEPVIMCRTGLDTEEIQKKLKHLWLISKVRSKLTDIRWLKTESSDELTTDQDFSLNGRLQPESSNEPTTFQDLQPFASIETAHTAHSKRFMEPVQSKVNSLIGAINAKLNAEAKRINARLTELETIYNPGTAERKALLVLLKKINLLKQFRKICHTGLNSVMDAYKFELRAFGLRAFKFRLFESRSEIDPDIEFETEIRELIKVRMLNFCAQLTQFLRSEIGEEELINIRLICQIQKDVIRSRDLISRFHGLVRRQQLRSLEYPEFQPPCFAPHHHVLRNLLTNPVLPLTHFKIYMDLLSVEQEEQIQLRLRQVKLGYELRDTLNSSITNQHNHRSVTVRSGNFSPNYICHIKALEKLETDLFSTEMLFTQAELDSTRNTVLGRLSYITTECRMNRFL